MSERPTDDRRWVRTVWHYVRPDSQSILAVMALLVSTSLVAAATPWPVTLVVDSVLGSEPVPGIWGWTLSLPGAEQPLTYVAWMGVAVVVLFIIQQALATARAAIEATAGNRIVYRIGGAIFDRIQQVPLTHHVNWPVGDLMNRIKTDATCGRDLAFHMITPATAAVVTVVTTSVVMVIVEPVLWLVAIASALPSAVAGPIGSRPLMRLQTENAEVDAERQAAVEQALTALPSVQVLGAEPIVERRYHQLADRLVGVRKRLALTEGVFGLVVDILFGASSATFLLVGGWMVLDGRLTLGRLLVFIAYVDTLHAPLQTLLHLTTTYAGASAQARRVLDVLDVEPLSAAVPELGGVGVGGVGDELPGHVTGGARIEFNNITFGYTNNQPILQNLNLTIEPGELIGLTGPSGSGKSTLIGLIPRLYDPWSGTITINNHNINTLNPTTLRNNIAVVLQEPFLFPVSIADNIAFGNPNATTQQIQHAAEQAGVTTFTNNLPNKLNTIIGERGTSLSGGERQRVAIARALVRNAPIVILDEPTSALDNNTETAVMNAIQNLAKGRTTILITHRPTTLTHTTRTINITQPHTTHPPTQPPTTQTIDHLLNTLGTPNPQQPQSESLPAAAMGWASATRRFVVDRSDIEVRVDQQSYYFTTDDSPVSIGRMIDNDVRIKGGDISRRHLELTWSNLGWATHDVSRNGSYDGLGRPMARTTLLTGQLRMHLGSLEENLVTVRLVPPGTKDLLASSGRRRRAKNDQASSRH